MIRRLGRVLLIVLVIAAIVVAGWSLQNRLFLQRLLTFQTTDTVADMSWYQSFDRVAGNPGSPLPRSAPDDTSIDPAALDAAQAYAADRNSIALLIWHRGRVQRAWYAEGFGPASVTDPRSMHKSVLALVVGLAIEDGAIASVDDPVSRYIDEWAGDARGDITIRQLLQMASGLDRYPFEANPLAPGMQFMIGQNIEPLVLDISILRPPGEVFSYNNINSQLLGMIVERATGQRYADYLGARLWSRLGTGDARVVTDRPGGMARTYCCLQVTAEDWLRLGLLHLYRGQVDGRQVVPQAWLAEVTTPSALNPNYGFQTWLGTVHQPVRGYGEGVALGVAQQEPFAAADVIFFDGADGQRVYIVPSRELVIVRVGYGGADFATGLFQWEDTGLPNLLIDGIDGKYLD